MRLPEQTVTPWQQGYDAGLAGQAAPPFPKGDASWSERLYASGWNSGARARVVAAEQPQK